MMRRLQPASAAVKLPRIEVVGMVVDTEVLCCVFALAFVMVSDGLYATLPSVEVTSVN